MSINSNVHFVSKITIEPIENSGGTYWRKITLDFCMSDGNTNKFEVCAYGKPEDLKIKIPAPLKAEVEI